MTPETQLDLFKQGVDLLGGPRSAAAMLDCTERTVFRLLNGTSALHEGWLRDVSKALLEHADRCRQLERQLSPAFASNLIDGQPREDGRRRRQTEDEFRADCARLDAALARQNFRKAR